MSFLHGLEITTETQGAQPIQGVPTGIIGLVGTAPLHLVASAYQTTNGLVEIKNPVEAARYFGAHRTGYSIPRALEGIFKQGPARVIVNNVFDPTTHVTALASTSYTFDDDDEIDVGHEGLDSVVVKDSTETTTYDLTDDYTVDLVTGIISRVDGGAIAAGATVKVACNYADPGEVDSADVVGEVDVSGNRTGLKLLKDAKSKFQVAVKLIIAPGYSTVDAVVDEMISVASDLSVRALAFADAPIGTTYANAIAGRGSGGSINFNHADKRLVLCFPHLKAYDVVAEAEYNDPMSSRLTGLIAFLDATRGYWVSPSNKQIKSVSGVERTLTCGMMDPNSEANLLNAQGIVCQYTGSTGVRAWGNRSSAYPSATTIDTFFPVQRTIDQIWDVLELAALQFVDEPISEALIKSITETVNGFIRKEAAKGALHVDSKVVYDPADNDSTEVEAGHLTWRLEYCPMPPLEKATFKTYLKTSLLANLAG